MSIVRRFERTAIERVTRKTLLDILDELRMRDGLEPIRKRA